jgi:hypothetical protein
MTYITCVRLYNFIFSTRIVVIHREIRPEHEPYSLHITPYKVDNDTIPWNIVFLNIFVANACISPFNTQTTHIKSFCTQQHCYVSLKTFCPGRIRTRVFSFLRRMRLPLRHAVGLRNQFRQKSFPVDKV